MSIFDDYLQMMFLDYIEKQQRSEFYNHDTKQFMYIPVPKRGNHEYAKKKGKTRDEISQNISKALIDEPVPGFRGLRTTNLLFVTLTFDPRKYTAAQAWAALKSTCPENSVNEFNVINRFDANITKIFGTHGKMVSKEAQANGYPAPHMLIILDKPVVVRRKKLKGDIVRWYIDDEATLRRLGKDAKSRALVKSDYRAAIDSNPVWKHGFYDIEGVVSGQKFNGRKNVCSYLFKYVSKCLTKDHSAVTSTVRTINEVKDHKLRVALFTHFCNKCFNNRDITYGQGFKKRIGLASKAKKEKEEGKKSPWSFIGLVDESLFTHMVRPPPGTEPLSMLDVLASVP
ncbi:MAG: hypothetical protein Q4Q58_05815 [Thermoplasmata archaeon]|nr:hypothetical protein [Thermoplasmata archaeon]